MPQRRFFSHRGELFKWRGGPDVPELSPTDERALSRTGYDKGLWDEIDWFVRLAREDLSQASQGDLLNLQEELVALMKVYLRMGNPSPPTLENILQFQRIVRQHLEKLADDDCVVLPELLVRHIITYPRRMETRQAAARGRPVREGYSADSCSMYLTPLSIDSLVAVMGRHLERADNLITRCPHCKEIFFQSRRNQEYCSRSCQSVAAMQKHRAEAKAQAEKKLRTKKSGPRNTRKGEMQHGKKRR